MSSKRPQDPKKPRQENGNVVDLEDSSEDEIDDDSLNHDKRTLRSKCGTRKEENKKHWALVNNEGGAGGGSGSSGTGKSRRDVLRSGDGNPSATKQVPLWVQSPGKPSQIQRLQAAAKLQIERNTAASNNNRKMKAQKVKKCSWVDRNLPATMDELFVHKKKVEEVMSWLKETMNTGDKRPGRSSKICLVTGPSGAGKTATVFLAAKELGLEVKEWINPMSLIDFNSDRLGKWEADEIQGKSQFDIFSDFLFRAAQYSTLPIKGRTSSKNKLIVVEDFPNTFYKNSDQFHNSILKPFASMSVFPVIFIIPDSTSRECNAFSLFPKTIMQDLNIRSISFNGVAISFMVKFLSTVCSKEGVPVDKSVVESVAAASNGDIRCAINTLEFKLSQAGSPALFKAPPANKKGSKSSKDLNKQFSDVQKDDTLFLFRALGKVLYCKRNATENVEQNNNVPENAQQYLRGSPLDDNPEHVVDKIEVPADSFLNFLQQNYLPFFGSMDDIGLACGFMADSEFLLSRWPFDDSGTLSRSYKEREAREEIALLIASRGLMYSNTHKTKSEFRPLKKPMMTDARTRITKSMDTAKQCFPLHGPLQMNFYTEVIPFYSKLLRRHATNWMLDQRECISMIGSINRNNRPHRFPDTLREKDAAEDSNDEDFDEPSGIPKPEVNLEDMGTQVVQQQQPNVGADRYKHEEPDEEYLIEDCSDED